MVNYYLLKIRTYWRLGFINLWRVGWYRTQIWFGIHPVQKINRFLIAEVFFNHSTRRINLNAPNYWDDEAFYFGRHKFSLNNQIPRWHVNPFIGIEINDQGKPWWQISDFNNSAGDIKNIWELSRFDWVLAFAQRIVTGNKNDLDKLNKWISSWLQHNPPFFGPNWKCGQEASIRVLHLMIAARILDQDDLPRGELLKLIELHLARIELTIDYAIGQDNNHSISESAALYIGGVWLNQNGYKNTTQMTELGQYWLENCVKNLIEVDGTFSQYSINYHRLVLDTLSIVELWRIRFNLPYFSNTFYQRCEAATRWLRSMVDPITGDAPNLGANDGANLLPLTNADYRDYRPSVELASVLFMGERTYSDPSLINQQLLWLGYGDLLNSLKIKKDVNQNPIELFHASGFLVIQKGLWKVLFRYPFYRFRPSHCDALHVDLWHGSKNIFRDSGTYSYNTSKETSDYFSGCTGHNVIQFDDREPMPKISNFLRGEWLKVKDLIIPRGDADKSIFAKASYCDWKGAGHSRSLMVCESKIIISDSVYGFQKKAVLRWRLPNYDWVIDGQKIYFKNFFISVSSTVPILKFNIIDGWESRYYMEKDPVKILEVLISEAGQIITTITTSNH